jgi:flagellar basal body-associated protein FliL
MQKQVSPPLIIAAIVVILVVVVGALFLFLRPKATVEKNVDMQQKQAEMQQRMKGMRSMDQSQTKTDQ